MEYVNWSARGTPAIMDDSIVGLARSLIYPIDNYEMKLTYSSMIRGLNVQNKCADSRWSAAFLQASNLFLEDKDEGRAMALVSIILKDIVGRSEQEIVSGQLSASLNGQKSLVIAVIIVCQLYHTFGKHGKARMILEALIELTRKLDTTLRSILLKVMVKVALEFTKLNLDYGVKRLEHHCS